MPPQQTYWPLHWQNSGYGPGDICDLQKCLTQTWVDFEKNVIEAAIDQMRDSLRSYMRAGGGQF